MTAPGSPAGDYETHGHGYAGPAGRAVTAVEPSAAMRAQRPPHRARAIAAVAERLPFADGGFDAAMATVTVHQWSDPDRGLRELRQVSRGPVVVLTFDGDALDRLWLAQYAPELIAAGRHRPGRRPAGRRPGVRRLGPPVQAPARPARFHRFPPARGRPTSRGVPRGVRTR